MSKVQAIPEGYTSVTPYLIVENVTEALNFYKKALGAEEHHSLKGPDGNIMHAEFSIGNARMMMGAACPERGAVSAKSLGGSPVGLCVYVENADKAFKKAKDAGMAEKMPVEDQFWGDRMGSLVDPFGFKWSLLQHVRDVSPEEMAEAMKKMCEMQEPQKKKAAK